MLALSRIDILPLRQWTPEQVIEWFHAIGLSESCNIIKYKRIDGEQISKADEDFLNDTLGITKQSEWAKFKYELSREKDGRVGEQTLFGWGSN